MDINQIAVYPRYVLPQNRIHKRKYNLLYSSEEKIKAFYSRHRSNHPFQKRGLGQVGPGPVRLTRLKGRSSGSEAENTSKTLARQQEWNSSRNGSFCPVSQQPVAKTPEFHKHPTLRFPSVISRSVKAGSVLSNDVLHCMENNN